MGISVPFITYFLKIWNPALKTKHEALWFSEIGHFILMNMIFLLSL